MLICKALESILRPHKTRCTSSSRFLIYFWWRIIQTTFRGPAFSWSRKWQKPLKSVEKWELCKNCKRGYGKRLQCLLTQGQWRHLTGCFGFQWLSRSQLDLLDLEYLFISSFFVFQSSVVTGQPAVVNTGHWVKEFEQRCIQRSSPIFLEITEFLDKCWHFPVTEDLKIRN